MFLFAHFYLSFHYLVLLISSKTASKVPLKRKCQKKEINIHIISRRNKVYGLSNNQQSNVRNQIIYKNKIMLYFSCYLYQDIYKKNGITCT